MTENTDVAIIEIKNKGALITVKVSEAQTFFTEKGKIAPILEGIREEAMLLVPDVSTKKGRDAIASAAYQVSTRKSAMQKHKMELSRKLKDIPKTVDANWREIEAYCDALRDEVRKPLDDFDAEQAALEAARKAEAAAAEFHRLAVEHEAWFDGVIAQDWEYADIANQLFDHEKEEARKAAELAQLKHDAAVAEAATAKAKADAEAEAKAVEAATMRREIEAKVAKENAEKAAAKAAQDLIDAKAKAAQDLIDAEQRANDAKAKASKELADATAKAAQEKIDAEQRAKEAAARAAQALIEATAAAVAKAAAEASAKEAAEAAKVAAIEAENRKREVDKAHIASIRRDVLDDLMTSGIDEATARAVIGAIVKKSVRHVAIAY
jgi:colicin import membrane protein